MGKVNINLIFQLLQLLSKNFVLHMSQSQLSPILDELQLIRQQHHHKMLSLHRQLLFAAKFQQQSSPQAELSMLRETVLVCYNILTGGQQKQFNSLMAQRLPMELALRTAKQDNLTTKGNQQRDQGEICLNCQSYEDEILKLKSLLSKANQLTSVKKRRNDSDSINLSTCHVVSFEEHKVKIETRALTKRMLQKDQQIKALKDKMKLLSQDKESDLWNRLVVLYRKTQPKSSITVLQSLSAQTIIQHLQKLILK